MYSSYQCRSGRALSSVHEDSDSTVREASRRWRGRYTPTTYGVYEPINPGTRTTVGPSAATPPAAAAARNLGSHPTTSPRDDEKDDEKDAERDRGGTIRARTAVQSSAEGTNRATWPRRSGTCR